MALTNCFDCNKLFDATRGARRCTLCLEAQERDWKLVRDFVKGNPGIHLDRVVEATEVTELRIREFMASGLLEPGLMSGMSYGCRKCGAQIAQGEYCMLCMGRLGREVTASLEKAAGTPFGAKAERTPDKPVHRSFAADYRAKRR